MSTEATAPESSTTCIPISTASVSASASVPVPAPTSTLDAASSERAREHAEPSSISAFDENPVPEASMKYPNGLHPMLRYCTPYWWPYRTFVKQRWIGRQLLEVIATEFRDRSVEYYRHALESGVTRINGVEAYPEYILRDGDRLDNTVHRHEPPVTNDPVALLHIDREREFCVISKPGSMPVHAAGRYHKHTMLELLMEEHGIKGYAVNRLDRLTSGLMILALSGPASRDLAQEFLEGKVGKEYIARVRGKFPEDEITVDQPLLTVDRQMGLVIIAPEGKEAKTVFKRMSYDAKRDQSVVHCRPLTGRTHQIRVHLQFLGHPITNDPIYASTTAFGPGCGKGGVDLVEQGEQNTQLSALTARIKAAKHSNGANGIPPPVPDDSARLAGKETGPEHGAVVKTSRVTDDVDLTSPIRLSTQARNVIATLRRQRDEAEDWIKWNEVVYKTKEAQEALAKDDDATADTQASASASASDAVVVPTTPADTGDATAAGEEKKKRRKIPHPRVNQGARAQKASQRPEVTAPRHMPKPAHIPEGFCDECFVPVPDDPDPSTLFIYLHALRYTTERLGTWSTPLPRWAAEEWDGDWRGWAGEKPVSVVPREVFADAVVEGQGEGEGEGKGDEVVQEEEGVRAVG